MKERIPRSAIDLNDYKIIHRLSLFHQTTAKCANSIIQNQVIYPSQAEGSYFGPGIYFANNVEATDQKAHNRGVVLVADCYLGKTYIFPREEKDLVKKNQKLLRDNGFKSLICYHLRTGREIVIFDPKDVCNIKYAYGEKPTIYRSLDRDRIVLFFVTDYKSAEDIYKSQKIPKINGPFGLGRYMFESITDALTFSQNQETFLAADAHIKNPLELNHPININSDKKAQKYKTFKGIHNQITYYVFKKSYNIEHIHFCGGRPWNI